MQANVVGLLKDVLENRRIFYIPVYQRNYSWKEEQCKQLFEDIMKLYNGECGEHFVGSIVWKPDDSDSNMLGVIDGQQRLTTMFLLIKALKDINDDRRLERSLEDILFDFREEKNRLVPIKSDNEVFKKILKDDVEEIEDKSSRIYQNFVYLKKELIKNNIDVNRFFLALAKLKVVKMELGYGDNSQVIFESINSTGMSLSIADLIRNFLLMNEKYEVQKKLFERYWYKFEKDLGVDNLVLFFEHYLNIKSNEKTINKNNIYKIFKVYFVKNNLNTRAFLEGLVDYIKCYKFLINDESYYNLSDKKKSKKLYEYKKDLIELGNKVTYMFLLEVLLDHKNEKITDEELLYTFELTISYVMRRSVCGLSSSGLQGIFRRLYSQVKEYSNSYGFIDALNYQLITSKRNTTGKFPSNEEFYTALYTRNLYGKYRSMNYLLFKLENFNNKTTIADDEISIEHIMPQVLNAEWKESLGENFKEKHEKNVNNLGNLTLTSYNSSLSNFNFNKKKEKLKQESHIKLNQYFIGCEKWDIEEIKKRGRKLAKMGLQVWQYPQINNDILDNIEAEKYDEVSLSELIENYISIKPNNIEIAGDVFLVNSFREIMVTTIKYSLEVDRLIFTEKFINSSNYTRTSENKEYFVYSNNKDKVYSPTKIMNEEIYWDNNRSGKNICILVSEILNEYNIDTNEVKIKHYR